MPDKSSYEELEQRVREFEKTESERMKTVAELHLKSALLEAQLASSIDGILVVDAKGKKILQNQRTVDLFKIPRHIADNDDDGPQVQHVINMTKNPEQFIKKITHLYSHPEERSQDEIELKDGTVLDRYSAPVVGKDGHYYGRVWTFHDITERKQAEESLRESEKLLKGVFNNAGIGISIADENMKLKMVNNRMAEMFGVSKDELLRTSFQGLTPPEDLNMSRERLKSFFEGENDLYRIEKRYSLKDGRTLWVDLSVSPIKDEDGHNVASIGMMADITNRKEAESALYESEKQYRHLFDQANEGLLMTTIDGQIYKVNQAFAEMHGYTIDELQHMDIWDLDVLGNSFQEDRADLMRRVQAGETVRLDVEHYHKDGHRFPLTVTTSMIDIGGKQFYLSFNQDITERKRVEEALRQAQKMESVGRLAGGVAHDFNNMLSVILGNIEMAMDVVDPDQPLYANLKDIRQAAQRSADITRQLLAFARKQTIAPKVIDLNEVIENVLKMLRRLIGEDIDLIWIPGKQLWPVKMDPSQLDQILANLSVNARDAITGKGKLTIETGNVTLDKTYCDDHPGFSPGDFVRLTVSDNGSGMNQETLENLFEPFFTTKGVDKGTGLGLATVYGVIKQNGGFVNVYSEPDRGTSFKIYLPSHAASGKKLHSEEKLEEVLRGNESILLVEDELSILKMTETMLKGLGYDVVAANTPEEAMTLGREHNGGIHLLMTDVVMPRMNGQELFKNLTLIYPNLKSLFMSGHTANVIAHHGVLDEDVNYIQKPFSKQELSAKLREILDAASS